MLHQAFNNLRSTSSLDWENWARILSRGVFSSRLYNRSSRFKNSSSEKSYEISCLFGSFLESENNGGNSVFYIHALEYFEVQLIRWSVVVLFEFTENINETCGGTLLKRICISSVENSFWTILSTFVQWRLHGDGGVNKFRPLKTCHPPHPLTRPFPLQREAQSILGFTFQHISSANGTFDIWWDVILIFITLLTFTTNFFSWLLNIEIVENLQT